MEMGRCAVERLCPSARHCFGSAGYAAIPRRQPRCSAAAIAAFEPLLPRIDPRFVMLLALRNDRSDLRRKIALRLLRQRVAPRLPGFGMAGSLQQARPHQQHGEIERR